MLNFILKSKIMFLCITLIFSTYGAANIEMSKPQQCENTNWATLTAGLDVTSRMITDHDVVSFASRSYISSALATVPGDNDYNIGQAADQSLGPLSKRGLSFENVDLANTFRMKCPSCSRAYNWGPRTEGLSQDLIFVPMLWDDSPGRTASWALTMTKAISDGCREVLSFNEPDNIGQANMTPEQAALSHVKYLNPYKDKLKIGAPSVSNSVVNGEGLRWLSEFFEVCAQQETTCAVDFCPVHWYSWDVLYREQWSSDLLRHLKSAYEICGGRPVWLTEFAVPGNDEITQLFLKEIIPELEELEYLSAYFYFFVSVGRLMSTDNSLSISGETYATLE